MTSGSASASELSAYAMPRLTKSDQFLHSLLLGPARMPDIARASEPPKFVTGHTAMSDWRRACQLHVGNRGITK